MSTKQALRAEIRQRWAAVTEEERRQRSRTLCERLLCHPRFRQAARCLLFHALPDEPDLSDVLRAGVGEPRLYLPTVVGDELLPRAYTPAALTRGAFGIMEPQGAPLLQLSRGDLIVVPGVAFDVQGYRLGRGRGYYDRFLSLPAFSSAYRIGCCFDFQLIDSVPREPHDVCVDEILSV
jgi:5-formyltetrahydrofolate cyclo-ligase